VVVGIEEYDSAQISPLKYAREDAQAFYQVLTDPAACGFSPERVKLLVDGEQGDLRPTNVNIVRWLDWVGRQADAEDTVVFYFSGHGIHRHDSNYLLSVNVEPASANTLAVSSVSLSELQQILAQIRARNVLVVLDACRNDPEASRGADDSVMTESFAKAVVVQQARRPAAADSECRATLFACKQGERAYEDPARRQGLFTYWLVQGLRGGAAGADGIVDLNGLTQYVTSAVSREAQASLGRSQTPWLQSAGTGRFQLSRDAERIAQIEAERVLRNEQFDRRRRALLALAADRPGEFTAQEAAAAVTVLEAELRGERQSPGDRQRRELAGQLADGKVAPEVYRLALRGIPPEAPAAPPPVPSIAPARPQPGGTPSAPQGRLSGAEGRLAEGLAEQIRPSVVLIEVEKKGDASPSADGKTDQDRWREFFGPDLSFPMPSTPQQQQPRVSPVGQGSGVVVDSAGYIVTNEHVVKGAARVTAHTTDGQALPARVVGADSLTDLAVIKVEASRSLAAAPLGDADTLEVGARTIAVGYPFGGSGQDGRLRVPQQREPTITVGVVTALNRQLESDSPGRPFRSLIQTDAPIDPGNSGGPLLDSHGRVIGISLALYVSDASAGSWRIGLAIPINDHTKSVIATLKQGESVARGRLGVMVEPLSDAMKEVWGAQHGVFVSEVDKGSPAGRAGFRNEDIVVSYQGQQIDTQEQFVAMVQGTRPGTRARIEVLRDGKRVTLTPTIGTLITPAGAQLTAAAPAEAMGLTVEPVPPDVAKQSGIREGVRVRAVAEGSDGARAGLCTDDLVIRVNRDLITDVASYQAAVQRLGKGEPVVLRIWRQGHYQTLEIPSLSQWRPQAR
jgi:serine protease Do